MLAFEGEVLPARIASRLAAAPAAGMSLFRFHNVRSPGQVLELTSAFQRAGAAAPHAAPADPSGSSPMLVAADQEGGQFIGLGEGSTAFAGNMALGAVDDVGPHGAGRARHRHRGAGDGRERRLRARPGSGHGSGQPGARDPLVRGLARGRRVARCRDGPRPPGGRGGGHGQARAGDGAHLERYPSRPGGGLGGTFRAGRPRVRAVPGRVRGRGPARDVGAHGPAGRDRPRRPSRHAVAGRDDRPGAARSGLRGRDDLRRARHAGSRPGSGPGPRRARGGPCRRGPAPRLGRSRGAGPHRGDARPRRGPGAARSGRDGRHGTSCGRAPCVAGLGRAGTRPVGRRERRPPGPRSRAGRALGHARPRSGRAPAALRRVRPDPRRHAAPGRPDARRHLIDRGAGPGHGPPRPVPRRRRDRR